MYEVTLGIPKKHRTGQKQVKTIHTHPINHDPARIITGIHLQCFLHFTSYAIDHIRPSAVTDGNGKKTQQYLPIFSKLQIIDKSVAFFLLWIFGLISLDLSLVTTEMFLTFFMSGYSGAA